MSKATLADFMPHFNVTLLNLVVMAAMFIGAMVAFVLFSGMTMQAVGRVAGAMVEEVRRQFSSDPGILQGTSEPDYARCVAISTSGAQREMARRLQARVASHRGGTGAAWRRDRPAGGSPAASCWRCSRPTPVVPSTTPRTSRRVTTRQELPAHHAAVIGDTVGDPSRTPPGPASTSWSS
ncbi:MAG: sodium/proton-translocating pyrophosphatase [Halioglobus sp.]